MVRRIAGADLTQAMRFFGDVPGLKTVIASGAKQSRTAAPGWIAAALRASQ